MIDIKLVREEPAKLKENLKKRKDPALVELVDEVRSADEAFREKKYEVDKLRQRRNELSEKINELMKAGKQDEAQDVIDEAKQASDVAEEAEEELASLKDHRDELLRKLPNLLHDSVPYGEDDDDNVPIRTWGDAASDEELTTHSEVAESLGASFDRSAKVAGHGFYYLYGDMARLNQALIQFAIDHVRNQGYTYVETPLMMRKEFVDATTDTETFDELIYKVEDEDAYMIATSEHPLMAQFAGEVLHRPTLPEKQVSYSMCFRKEVGTHSVDEKGLYRTHQFNKVEMVAFTEPEDSWAVHEELLEISTSLFEQLEIPYRVVNVCTGDLGSIASKKYDIEAWFPRQDEYKEVVSCSNCTDYQARELDIKYETEDGGHAFVHTLNSTAIATSRAMVAILENFQNDDGSVTVPEALRDYLGTDRLEPNDDDAGSS